MEWLPACRVNTFDKSIDRNHGLHKTKKNKRWVLPKDLPADIDLIFEQYPCPLRQILYNRGFTELDSCQKFLSADYLIHDPFLISNMEKAVDRILQSVHYKLPIAIYGDYDVDGVTATALLVQVIHALGGTVIPYIPDRFEEGYGLNTRALEMLRGSGLDLVITVDCGIRSVKEVKQTNQQGLDIIISDHHAPRNEVPPALAVICPKQEGDDYINKELSGVGLAYKIAQALILKNPQFGLAIENWLDLVTLGSVADMVPLVEENRTMVRLGLQELRQGSRLGILALAEVSGLELKRLSSSDIGFMLGPRLNAAGRVESARKAFQLLMVEDKNSADVLAQELNAQNQERQSITREIQKEAQVVVQESDFEYVLFAAEESFNEGIIGLAASKLTEEFYRPAMVGTRKKVNNISVVRASCRSIPEFHITKALDECAELLMQHGGHALAAGFTILEENLAEFLQRMEKIAMREMQDKDLAPKLEIDAQVSISELTYGLLSQLEQFEPTGAGNPTPLFISKNVGVSRFRTVGKDMSHLLMTLNDGHISCDAIAFNFGELAEKLPDRVNVVFTYERNTYQGQDRPQMRIVDIQYDSN